MEKIKILIADDEEMLRDIYEIILDGSFPCTIISVKNGQEAIDQLNKESDFDLIISDYGMPIVNGAGLFNFNKANLNIPMFILSGGELQDYSDFVGFNFANSSNRFITKPFDDVELVDLVKELIIKVKFGKNENVQSSNDELIKISLKHLVKYTLDSSEVFLKLHDNKYTKIVNDNHETAPDKEVLNHYLQKNIEFVYVTKNHFLKLVKSTIDQLKSEIEAKKPSHELLQIAGLQFHISLSGLNSIGVTPLQVELVTDVIEDTITEIAKDPLASHNLKQMCEEEGFLIGHSLIIMLIAGSLCKETQLNFVSTMKRICLAAFFHDFSLIENDYSHHELKLYLIEDEGILQKIINHSSNSAKFLPELKEVIDDTKRIILEHHEMPNGDGYPKKLNANQIAPISCLFILAQQITFCLLRNDFDNDRLKSFIKNNEIIFNKGNFAKFYSVAAKKFS